MIILICGFSASGKSYASRFVAKKLNYKMIHTSDVLRQILENKVVDISHTQMNTGWYEKSEVDLKRKKNTSIDKKLDQYLLKLIDNKDNLVLDSWTLPYLSKKGIKIWLDADLAERAKRAALRGDFSYNESVRLTKKKDDFSKKHFKELYGFTLGKDLNKFDLVLDTNNLSIPEVENAVLNFIKKKN
jgi:predicted cytidylate kinase